MITKNQEILAILKKIADFPVLQKKPVLQNFLDKAVNVLPDSEKEFVEHLISEEQEKCEHKNDPIFVPLVSLSPLFQKICSGCGKILKSNVRIESL